MKIRCAQAFLVLLIAASPLTAAAVPTVAWHFDTGNYVECSPAIADINKSVPGSEVLIGNMFSLFCLSSSGNLLWSYHDPQRLFIHPAAADLDADGNAEVIFHSIGYPAEGRIFCFESDGRLSWTFPTFSSGYNQGPAIVDIDKDWQAEIVVGSTADTIYCIDASGILVWKRPTNGDVCTPAVCDINEDGNPEVIFGTIGGRADCLDSRGNLLWETVIDGVWLLGISISDVDMDGAPEIIITGFKNERQNMLYCLERNGTVKWSFQFTDRLGCLPSTAAIDDINRDGKPEMAVFSNSLAEEKDSLWVLQDGGSGAKVLWQAPAADWWGGSTSGPVICDINGDTFKELILVGSQYLGVFDGRDGSLICMNSDIRSITRDEHPAVADVDQDGHAEIIGTYRYQGVAMVEDDGNWIGCRNQFSSHCYHITNIKDDLTIPALELLSWKTHNSWLAQGYYPVCDPLCLKENVVALLDSLKPHSSGAAKRIKEARKHVLASLAPELWVDENHLSPKKGDKVFYEEKKAVYEIEKLCEIEFQGEVCERLIGMLVRADSMLARIAIDEAKAANGDPKEIKEAEKEFAKALEELANGNPKEAIEHFKHAWEHAMKAIQKMDHGQMIWNMTFESSTHLLQSRPNPARSSTSFEFILDGAGSARLAVYDVAGREVWESTFSSPGFHSVEWACVDMGGKPVPSGVYIYRLEAPDFAEARQIAVVR
jgi:hypothetical protein